MHQNRFRLALHPRPRCGSLQRSPSPLGGYKGPTFKGMRGAQGRGGAKVGKGKKGGKGKEGGEGKKGSGKGILAIAYQS